jgi:PII-like signaling protein
MLSPGKALKVSVYVSEGSTRRGVATYSAILDFLFYRGISGATVLKGIAGFGADHHMHSASSVEISDRLPLIIQFVETPEKVNAILGKLEELVGSGMIEMHETTVAKPAQSSQPKPAVPAEHLRIDGAAQLMRIYIAESDRWRDKPLHEALVEAMRANEIAGVTVLRGVHGYRTLGDRPLQHSHAHSILLSVIDSREKIAGFLPLVEQMVEEGLVVLSDVDVIKYAYRAAGVER